MLNQPNSRVPPSLSRGLDLKVFKAPSNHSKVNQEGDNSHKLRLVEDNLKPRQDEGNHKLKLGEDNHKPKLGEDNHKPKLGEDNHKPKPEGDSHRPKLEEANNLKPKQVEASLLEEDSQPAEASRQVEANLQAEGNQLELSLVHHLVKASHKPKVSSRDSRAKEILW